MPIRFRCAFCNQLMGIARRKAGTIVRCPKCAGQVVVPVPENGSAHDLDVRRDEPAAPPTANEGFFEQSDFEDVFDQGTGAGQPRGVPPIVSGHAPMSPRPLSGQGAAAPMAPEFEAVPLSAVRKPARGIFVTSGLLAVISAVVVVLMGMAFFLGLLLGRSAPP